MFRTLLQLQELDLRIEAFKARELEIPKQKGRFDIYRKRLATELEEREKVCQHLQIEQKECEVDIDERQAQIAKYNQQLLAVKKNTEYQALVHEIDMLKKQIGLKEERVIALMLELDDAHAGLDEDKKRIEGELSDIEGECSRIDRELDGAVEERKRIESERGPLLKEIDADLLVRYKRIRRGIGTGPALVPLTDEFCGGCHMRVTPQVANDVLAGNKKWMCAHCGRLLYDPRNLKEEEEAPV